jgi:hypothetical protein
MSDEVRQSKKLMEVREAMPMIDGQCAINEKGRVTCARVRTRIFVKSQRKKSKKKEKKGKREALIYVTHSTRELLPRGASMPACVGVRSPAFTRSLTSIKLTHTHRSH